MQEHPEKLFQASSQGVPAPGVQPCGLAEALWQAPALLAAIPTQDWNALIACSKQLQHIVHISVQAIAVSDWEDVKAIVQHRWPQLALIQVIPKCVTGIYHSLPNNDNVELVAAIEFDTQAGSAMGYLVEPEGTQHQHSWRTDAAVLRLQRQQCPHASELCLHIEVQPEQVLQHLNQGQWSGVERLDLSSSNIDAAAIKHMRRDAWPSLKVLDLSYNNIGEDALVNSQRWLRGSLRCLILDGNPLTASAVSSVPYSACQSALQKLSLSEGQLSSAGAASLTAMHYRLVELSLDSTGFSTSALSQLLSVPWPLLQHLNLSDNALAADAMAVLTSAILPRLVSLDISSNKLDAAAATHLVGSKWRHLWQLNVSNNRLDNVAMAALAKGGWPALKSLDLCGNLISAEGVEALMEGDWPLLKELILDISTASPATLSLLSLERVEAWKYSDPSDCLLTQRHVLGHHVWPLLVGVRFYSDITSLPYQFDLRPLR